MFHIRSVFRSLSLSMLFVLIIARKGAAYMQMIPGIYFADLFLVASLIQVRFRDLIKALLRPEHVAVLILALYGVFRLLIDASYGQTLIADYLKNAALVIYPASLYVGYVWYKSAHASGFKAEGWYLFLTVLFITNALFSLAYPFSLALKPLVWQVADGVPFLFTYSANTFFLPVGLLFFITIPFAHKFVRLLGILLSILGIFLLMERASFVSVVISLLIIFSLHRLIQVITFAGRGLIVVAVSGFLLGSFGGLVESSRVDLSISGIAELISSIFVESNNQALDGSRGHRLEMWGMLLSDNFDLSNPTKMIFGAGFSRELMSDYGILFRAPHNSFVHIIWRSGLVGLLLINIAIWVTFFHFVLRVRHLARVRAEALTLGGQYWGLAICVIIVCDSSFGTLFESPFACVPAFFLLGVQNALHSR